MPTYPQNSGTATANTVFGTTAAAAEGLASQILNLFNVSFQSEILEIRGNNGAIIGRWDFNATQTGDFEVLDLTSGGLAKLPGETLSLNIDGTVKAVIINNHTVRRVNNDTVKRSFTWTYYPALTPA